MDKKKIRAIAIFGVLLIISGIVCSFIFKPPVTYIVTFNTEGGTSIEPITVVENHPVIQPKDPYKVGYLLKGWRLNDVDYDFADLVTQDITLTAIWVEINSSN